MSAAYASRAQEEDDFTARSDEEEYAFDEYEQESEDDERRTAETSERQSERDHDSGDEDWKSEQESEEYTRTLPSTADSASTPPHTANQRSARSAFSATVPLSAPPSRPLSAQSRSQLVTSAISDEEASDSDASSDGQDEYDERAVARHTQLTPTARPQTADNSASKLRPTPTSTRNSRPATAAATRQPYEPSSLALRLEASGTIEAIKPLTGQEWKARLQHLKARIVREGYSRGERLDSGEEEKQQLDLSTDTDSQRASITSLNQAGFARAALLSQQAATASTARSSASGAPSPHTSLALKWNAYAKDQEGMEQELKALKRDKRHLLALIDTHTQQLATTHHKHSRLLTKLTALAQQKGMLLVTAADGRTRAEAAGEVAEGEGVRLNPLLSVQQVAVCLQREIGRLEVEKERKECEQDEVEEQQRLEEETAAEDERREKQLSRDDDDYSDDEEQQRPRLTQRQRLRVVRVKKAALLQQVHELQEQLQRGGGESVLSSKEQAAAKALIVAIATARTHADTYEEQLGQRQRQLERVREENDRLARQMRAAISSDTKAVKHKNRV